MIFMNAYTEYYLAHHGVKGMKWGVRKSEYKTMNRNQRKETRKQYYKTPEGKIKKATTIGTILAGPIGGLVAGSIATKKVGSIKNDTVDKGKQCSEKFKNTKIDSSDKTKNAIKNASPKSGETDEQKVNRLIKEGKMNPDAHYIFDQNGNLVMVTWD